MKEIEWQFGLVIENMNLEKDLSSKPGFATQYLCGKIRFLTSLCLLFLTSKRRTSYIALIKLLRMKTSRHLPHGKHLTNGSCS